MRHSLHRLPFVFALIFAGFTTALTPTHAAPSLAGKRVLFLGDSITQDGRYVTFLEYTLRRQTPPVASDIISIGLGSETISGLSEPGHAFVRPCVLARLERALDLIQPEIVFACYGMNDGIYHAPDPAREAAFRQGLDRFVKSVHTHGAELIIITPPVWDGLPLRARLAPEGATEFSYGKPYARYDDVLATFARHELSLAGPHLHVIDLHSAMAGALTARRTIEAEFTFSPDGVHPGDEGHLVIARTIASGLGLTVPEAPDLKAELARIKADPLFAPVAARRKARSSAWLACVGYTREKTVSADNADAGEAEAARLLKEIEAILTTP